ncbi:cytochrome b5-like [Lethenteron reissneri]|uniref:cytochrome b5-like n=1 Tax=Lethenteron reissneri TaxID=7753 RepID=UPI002AB60654|nr:cytochrome b5-like [Lethenteron reissneri]
MSARSGREEEAPRLVSLDELRKHCTSESTWIVLHDKVYDVTSFLDKHPGGTAVLLDRGGQDATDVFEDEGHTLDARELAKGFVVGKVHPKDLKILEKDRAVGLKESKADNVVQQESRAFPGWVIPSLLVLFISMLFLWLVPNLSTSESEPEQQ